MTHFFVLFHHYADQASIEYRQLGQTGMNLALIGMGGSGYGNVYRNFDEKESIDAVNYAIDCGINYIDTAYWYGQGQSELFLGKALKNIPRDKFFIGTKVGRYESKATEMFNFSAEKVTKSAEESLQRLQLDYVDILQIHDVEFAPSIDVIVNETLPAIDHLRKRGLCRFVGITGYPIDALREVLERSAVTIDSALSYCRLTLWDPSLIEHFSYFQSKGVPLINASPIGMGLLASAPLQPWHPASDEIKQACVQAVKHCEEEGVNISRLAIHYATKFKEVRERTVSCSVVPVGKGRQTRAYCVGKGRQSRTLVNCVRQFH